MMRAGWESRVQEGFRQLGDHCARNQVGKISLSLLKGKILNEGRADPYPSH